MIIGIVGFIGSGKGTVGDILAKKYSYTPLSFADSLKDATSNIFGWDRKLLEGDTEESRKFRECPDEWWSKKLQYEVTPRNVLQRMGTEAMRNGFHENIWIYSLQKKIEQHSSVIITDCRFPNEIDFIKSIGGHVIRVIRGSDPIWYDAAIQKNLNNTENKILDSIHYSEWAWIGTSFDYVLYNEGSLSMLEADIDHMIKVFSGPIKKQST